MARGIVIPLSANPRDLIRGLRISEDAVEDLAKEFDKVERSADDVSDEFRDLGRNADRSFDKARRSADRLEDSLSDVEDEANQSAKEFGSSFRGDPVEALEEVQSYIAEIVSIRLPGLVGALAGIAGGAALGLIVTQIDKWREAQEQIKQQAVDLYNQYVENGRVMDENWKKEQLNAYWAEQSIDKRNKIFDLLEQAGISQDKLNELLSDGELTMKELSQATRDTGRESKGLNPIYLRLISETEDLANVWGRLNGVVLKDTQDQLRAIREDVMAIPDRTITITARRKLVAMEEDRVMP